MAHYLLTGVAGFIAARVAEMLLDEDHTVAGVDNLNDAYDVRMKEYRLERLRSRQGFTFQIALEEIFYTGNEPGFLAVIYIHDGVQNFEIIFCIFR